MLAFICVFSLCSHAAVTANDCAVVNVCRFRYKQLCCTSFVFTVWQLHCSIKGVKVPVVILHALDDGIVPYELGHKVRIRSHDIVCLLLTVKCVLGL